jgi:3-dehydroquinate synthase
VVSLDAPLWEKYRATVIPRDEMIRDARALKARVCAEDPYEVKGSRRVLNFGHTFGHVLESVSRFALSHGDAVGLGMLCALDVGQAMGVTSVPLAEEVEAGLDRGPGVLGRAALARLIQRSGAGASALSAVLGADKKNEKSGELKMILLRDVGRTEILTVPKDVWAPLWKRWKEGRTP